MANESLWVLTPFNKVFNLVFALFILILILASLLLRGKSEKTRVRVLVGACLVTLVGFFVYKYCLSIDEAYDALTQDKGGFNWWGELPLHLCNINMILIPIAVLRKNRPLMGFCFFLAPLGALMALAMPGVGFSGYSILLPRMLGYFGTHFMIVIEGLAIATFGLFRPTFRDIPKTLLMAFVICCFISLIDFLLRYSGLYANANYFYAIETEGNFLLELFHKWIPIPCLYLLPCFAILGIYMFLITLGFAIADRIGNKKNHA